MSIPWEEIKEEYITTCISQREIAQKYGTTAVSVNTHSKKENWLQLREEYKQKKAEELNNETPKPKENGVLFLRDGADGPKKDLTNRQRYERYAIASLSLPKIDTNDPFQVQQRINDYFECCYTNGIKPQKPGVAKWLGIHKGTLERWYRGETKQATHQQIIEDTFTKLEEDLVDQVQSGSVNPASGIFLLKNHFHYKDQQDVVVAQKNPLGPLQNLEELRKRIEGCIIDDLEEVSEKPKDKPKEEENA